MAKWNVEEISDTYQITEGYAYVRIQGSTYCVSISEFKLHATTGKTEVSLIGILKDK